MIFLQRKMCRLFEYIYQRNLKEIKRVPYNKIEQKLVDTPYFIPNSVSRIWLHEYKFCKFCKN